MKAQLPENLDTLSREKRSELVRIGYAYATKYGEGAAAASCEMYDAIAKASGVDVPDAEPAETATYPEAGKAVNGTLKTGNAEIVAGSVGRMVKMAGVDTMMKNAIRDGAEWAWIPQGNETCAFCIMLASRGWQRASKAALNGDHADHIHAHCDCMYAIRFDSETNVEGYDPEKYKAMYDEADGDTWEEKLNSMRRDIAAQKRESEKESVALADENATLIKKAIQDQVQSSTSSALVDAIIENHEALKHFTPEEMKQQLEEAGFEVKSLGGRSRHVANLPFEKGGGFRIQFGGDGYFQYHPEGGRHGIAYWKVVNGKQGKHWYDTEGKEHFFGKKS